MAATQEDGARLAIKIVTPTGPILDGEFDEITAPGLYGEFGVLPGHIPFLTALRPGVLKLRSGQSVQVFAVGRGYAEVGTRNHVEILVDQSQPADQIDADAARRSIEDNEKALAGGSEERERLNAEIAWARARLDARGSS